VCYVAGIRGMVKGVHIFNVNRHTHRYLVLLVLYAWIEEITYSVSHACTVVCCVAGIIGMLRGDHIFSLTCMLSGVLCCWYYRHA
jgi:hypothetical protein